MAFGAIQASLGEVERNDWAWTWTIYGGKPQTPYLTRTIFPRVAGVRPLMHRIWRDDQDPHPHNHPWAWAKFIVISGGYTDERWFKDEDGWYQELTNLKPGNVNRLDAGSFHRAVNVLPETRTIGLAGPQVQEWGFLVGDTVVPWEQYINGRPL